MIIIKNASLQIKKTRILENINVSFEDGYIYGIIGRNGCGKTMLMKCICGFIKVTEGEIIVNNQVVGKDVDFPNSIGCIIETPGFIPYYSGYRNLKILADLNKKTDKVTIFNTMEKVGLNPRLKVSVKKYSLGMRQRLGLAQAIMDNPDILILDEPMNGLDEDGVLQMRNYLLEYKREGKTVILASHSAEDISILCDKVYQMEKGKLVNNSSK